MEDLILSNVETVGVGLILLYVIYELMKQNDVREQRLIAMIIERDDLVQKQQDFISKQNQTMEDISITVKETSDSIRELSRDVADMKIRMERLD